MAMSSLEFALALFALLLTPGPTNTLIALAGAERGWTGALRLVPVEAAAYGLVTLPLAILGSSLSGEHGTLRLFVTLAAAAWVAYLAVTLWRVPQADAMGPGQNGALRLFITTLSNPKGLIIGLVLLPSQPDTALAAAGFLAILLAVSAFWAGLGSLAGGGIRLMPVLRRVCAGWLGLLALWLASTSLAG
jgi:threonine/homoserine/homoserine lactone efflux protein